MCVCVCVCVCVYVCMCVLCFSNCIPHQVLFCNELYIVPATQNESTFIICVISSANTCEVYFQFFVATIFTSPLA